MTIAITVILIDKPINVKHVDTQELQTSATTTSWYIVLMSKNEWQNEKMRFLFWYLWSWEKKILVTGRLTLLFEVSVVASNDKKEKVISASNDVLDRLVDNRKQYDWNGLHYNLYFLWNVVWKFFGKALCTRIWHFLYSFYWQLVG